MSRPAAVDARDLQRRMPDRVLTALRRYRRGGRRARALRRVAAVFLMLLAAGFASIRPSSPGDGTAIVVAARDLDIGVVLAAADLSLQAVADPPDGAVRASNGGTAGTVGRTLASPVRSGEILTDVRLLGQAGPRAGPGRVAVPARLGDADVVELLRPGMHVALVSVPRDGTAPARSFTDDAVVLSVADAATGALSAQNQGRIVVFAVPSAAADAVAAAGLTGAIALRFH
jgi:Flp pilus assembly protein CpaB